MACKISCGVYIRDVNKARGVKAKANKPRPETYKAKATDPRPKPRMRT